MYVYPISLDAQILYKQMRNMFIKCQIKSKSLRLQTKKHAQKRMAKGF